MKRRLKCISIIAILILLQALPVSATPVLNGTLDATTDITAKNGDVIDIDLTLTGVANEVDALQIVYDIDENLEVVSGEFTGPKGTICDVTNGKCLWANDSSTTINGDFFCLKLKVKDSCPTVADAKVTFTVTGTNGNTTVFRDVKVTSAVAIRNGVTVSGTCKCFGEGESVIELYKKDGTEPVATVTVADGQYTLSSVTPGNYILKVNKAKHATREYEITVEALDVVQNVEIYQYGDFTMDGVISAADATEIYKCALGVLTVEDEYKLELGNVIQEGTSVDLDAQDATEVYKMALFN